MKLSRIVPVAIVLCAFTLASCANTVRGVGRDVKGTAHAVQETVRECRAGVIVSCRRTRCSSERDHLEPQGSRCRP